MRNVAIVGIGMIKFGELWTKSLRDLCVEAAQNCFTAVSYTHLTLPTSDLV